MDLEKNSKIKPDIKDILRKNKILKYQNERLLYYLNCNKHSYQKRIQALELQVKNFEDSIKDLQKENINTERVQDENMAD